MMTPQMTNGFYSTCPCVSLSILLLIALPPLTHVIPPSKFQFPFAALAPLALQVQLLPFARQFPRPSGAFGTSVELMGEPTRTRTPTHCFSSRGEPSTTLALRPFGSLARPQHVLPARTSSEGRSNASKPAGACSITRGACLPPELPHSSSSFATRTPQPTCEGM